MSDRGKIVVYEYGFLMKIYNKWRYLKGWGRTERSQIDLCHFMRVILIFAPWRVFWQSRIFGLLTAAEIIIGAAGVGGVISLFILFTNTMLIVLLLLGVIIGMLTLIAILFWLSEKYKKQLDAFSEKLNRFFTPIGEFLVKRWFSFNLFGTMYSFMIAPFLAILLFGGGIIASQVTLWILYWATMAIVYGSIIGVTILLAGAIYGIAKFAEWWDSRPKKAVVLKEKKKKDHETARVFWQFLVAKKHRICPLIEVVD